MFLSMPSFTMLTSVADKSTINLHLPSLLLFGIKPKGLQCMFNWFASSSVIRFNFSSGSLTQWMDWSTASCNLLVATGPFRVGSRS